MSLTERYANFDLATGANDGTSEADAWQSWSDVTSGVAAGQRVNVKQTASRDSANLTFSVNGSNGNPIVLRGYGSTIGDGVKFEGSGAYLVSGDYVEVHDLDIRHSGADIPLNKSGKAGIVRNCIVIQTDTSLSAAKALSCLNTVVVNCYIEHNGSGAAVANYSAASIQRSVLKGCTVVGSGNAAAVYCGVGFSGASIEDCVIVGNGGYGVYVASASSISVPSPISGCSIYDVSDGIYFDSSPDSENPSIPIIGNIIYSASGHGINNADATYANNFALASNAMGAITSGRLSGMMNYEESDPIVLTADPFTDAAGGDFTLNSTAGGGALLRGSGRGYADPNQDGAQENFADHGAIQHEDSGGGGFVNREGLQAIEQGVAA